MSANTAIATESQLGRLKGDTAITRPSLMKELTARGVRMTSQRRLLVGIIQDSPRHLDAAALLELAQQARSGNRPRHGVSNDSAVEGSRID